MISIQILSWLGRAIIWWGQGLVVGRRKGEKKWCGVAWRGLSFKLSTV